MQLSSSATRGERFGLDAATSSATDELPLPPRGASPFHHSAAPRHLVEPDTSSVSSDYSELGEPIREHLAGVQIICREDLDLGNTVPDPAAVDCGRDVDGDRREGSSEAAAGSTEKCPRLSRYDDETDEQFARRVRKTNYLSLAQVRR